LRRLPAELIISGLDLHFVRGSGSGEQRRRAKGDRLSVLFCMRLYGRVTSEPHLGQCRGRVDVCGQAHLPPLCGLGCPRLLGLGGEANRVAADQQVRRKAITRRQTEHNLSHLDGIADLFTPIRFQGLGNSADRRLILREEFGRALVRASASVCPHPAGFKGVKPSRRTATVPEREIP
jgi:hypothetical protein